MDQRGVMEYAPSADAAPFTGDTDDVDSGYGSGGYATAARGQAGARAVTVDNELFVGMSDGKGRGAERDSIGAGRGAVAFAGPAVAAGGSFASPSWGDLGVDRAAPVYGGGGGYGAEGAAAERRPSPGMEYGYFSGGGAAPPSPFEGSSSYQLSPSPQQVSGGAARVIIAAAPPPPPPPPHHSTWSSSSSEYDPTTPPGSKPVDVDLFCRVDSGKLPDGARGGGVQNGFGNGNGNGNKAHIPAAMPPTGAAGTRKPLKSAAKERHPAVPPPRRASANPSTPSPRGGRGGPAAAGAHLLRKVQPAAPRRVKDHTGHPGGGRNAVARGAAAVSPQRPSSRSGGGGGAKGVVVGVKAARGGNGDRDPAADAGGNRSPCRPVPLRSAAPRGGMGSCGVGGEGAARQHTAAATTAPAHPHPPDSPRSTSEDSTEDGYEDDPPADVMPLVPKRAPVDARPGLGRFALTDAAWGTTTPVGVWVERGGAPATTRAPPPRSIETVEPQARRGVVERSATATGAAHAPIDASTAARAAAPSPTSPASRRRAGGTASTQNTFEYVCDEGGVDGRGSLRQSAACETDRGAFPLGGVEAVQQLQLPLHVQADADAHMDAADAAGGAGVDVGDVQPQLQFLADDLAPHHHTHPHYVHPPSTAEMMACTHTEGYAAVQPTMPFDGTGGFATTSESVPATEWAGGSGQGYAGGGRVVGVPGTAGVGVPLHPAVVEVSREAEPPPRDAVGGGAGEPGHAAQTVMMRPQHGECGFTTTASESITVTEWAGGHEGPAGVLPAAAGAEVPPPAAFVSREGVPRQYSPACAGVLGGGVHDTRGMGPRVVRPEPPLVVLPHTAGEVQHRDRAAAPAAIQAPPAANGVYSGSAQHTGANGWGLGDGPTALGPATEPQLTHWSTGGVDPARGQHHHAAAGPAERPVMNGEGGPGEAWGREGDRSAAAAVEPRQHADHCNFNEHFAGDAGAAYCAAFAAGLRGNHPPVGTPQAPPAAAQYYDLTQHGGSEDSVTMSPPPTPHARGGGVGIARIESRQLSPPVSQHPRARGGSTFNCARPLAPAAPAYTKKLLGAFGDAVVPTTLAHTHAAIAARSGTPVSVSAVSCGGYETVDGGSVAGGGGTTEPAAPGTAPVHDAAPRLVSIGVHPVGAGTHDSLRMSLVAHARSISPPCDRRRRPRSPSHTPRPKSPLHAPTRVRRPPPHHIAVGGGMPSGGSSPPQATPASGGAVDGAAYRCGAAPPSFPDPQRPPSHLDPRGRGAAGFEKCPSIIVANGVEFYDLDDDAGHGRVGAPGAAMSMPIPMPSHAPTAGEEVLSAAAGGRGGGSAPLPHGAASYAEDPPLESPPRPGSLALCGSRTGDGRGDGDVGGGGGMPAGRREPWEPEPTRGRQEQQQQQQEEQGHGHVGGDDSETQPQPQHPPRDRDGDTTVSGATTAPHTSASTQQPRGLAAPGHVGTPDVEASPQPAAAPIPMGVSVPSSTRHAAGSDSSARGGPVHAAPQRLKAPQSEHPSCFSVSEESGMGVGMCGVGDGTALAGRTSAKEAAAAAKPRYDPTHMRLVERARAAFGSGGGAVRSPPSHASSRSAATQDSQQRDVVHGDPQEAVGHGYDAPGAPFRNATHATDAYGRGAASAGSGHYCHEHPHHAPRSASTSHVSGSEERGDGMVQDITHANASVSRGDGAAVQEGWGMTDGRAAAAAHPDMCAPGNDVDADGAGTGDYESVPQVPSQAQSHSHPHSLAGSIDPELLHHVSASAAATTPERVAHVGGDCLPGPHPCNGTACDADADDVEIEVVPMAEEGRAPSLSGANGEGAPGGHGQRDHMSFGTGAEEVKARMGVRVGSGGVTGPGHGAAVASTGSPPRRPGSGLYDLAAAAVTAGGGGEPQGAHRHVSPHRRPAATPPASLCSGSAAGGTAADASPALQAWQAEAAKFARARAGAARAIAQEEAAVRRALDRLQVAQMELDAERAYVQGKCQLLTYMHAAHHGW